VRIEHTSSDQTGDEEGVLVTRSTSETEVNPSAHLRWDVVDWATLRASYARTVRRPNFNQRIPFAQFDDPDDDDVTRGNPGVDLETSQGIDLGVEFNLPDRGIAGFNFFYRDISDLIQLVRVGDNDDGGGDYTFENVGDAEVWGLEFDLSTPLAFIGLPDTGVFANYVRLFSEKADAFSGQNDVRIDRQPSFVYNVGLTHHIPQWGVTFGVSYQKQGAFQQFLLDEVERGNVDGNLEVFLEKRFLDDTLVARVTGNNLLDAGTLQWEEVFDGPVSEGNIDEYEIEWEESTPSIQFTLRWNF
jgi:outer membrane receptor protein involved in Fe transport